MTSLRTHHGLPLADLATHRGLPRASLASIDGLGPLPAGGATPVSGLPAPTYYWTFDSTFLDAVSGLELADYGGSSGIAIVPYAKLSSGASLTTSGSQVRRATIAPGTAMYLSFWMKSPVAVNGLAFSGCSFVVDGNEVGIAPDVWNAAVWDDATWHHVFVAGTGVYLDGVPAGSVGSPSGATAVDLICATIGGTVDELAVFIDPEMGSMTTAELAAAIWNDGYGAFWRDGAWMETEAPLAVPAPTNAWYVTATSHADIVGSLSWSQNVTGLTSWQAGPYGQCPSTLNYGEWANRNTPAFTALASVGSQIAMSGWVKYSGAADDIHFGWYPGIPFAMEYRPAGLEDTNWHHAFCHIARTGTASYDAKWYWDGILVNTTTAYPNELPAVGSLWWYMGGADSRISNLTFWNNVAADWPAIAAKIHDEGLAWLNGAWAGVIAL